MGINVEKLKRSLKNRTFIPVIIHALRNRWPLWWIRSKAIREVQLEDRAYKILKKKYASLISNSFDESYLSEKVPKQFWICWLQGMEKAPELVKSCYRSLKKQFPDYIITVISSENISEYIEIPDVIYKKWENGVIGNAHFSDILRVELLRKFGGIWIDSTVYCTGIPTLQVIEKSPFFMYKSLSSVEERISSSNWLIASIPNHPFMVTMSELLRVYWTKENVAIHYYLFHILFTIIVESFPDLWKSVPTYTNATPHIMVNELNNDFSKERYQQLCKISDFHKLNYKKDYSTESGTLYHYLLNQ